jgi:nitrogenase molybdenum-iron protein alpha/beta subunit
MVRQLKTEVDRNMVLAQIQRLDLSKNYSIEINQKKKVRTLSQNRLERLWLTCISFETGEDTDVLHDIFKKKWLEPEIIEKYGVKVERYTTTNLNTIQFKYFLDKIQTFANSELGIVLPNPDEKYWEEFFDFYTDKM